MEGTDVEDIGREARAVVVALWEQLPFRDLETLVRGPAGLAVEDVDGIFAAHPRIANLHQIVTHRMCT